MIDIPKNEHGTTRVFSLSMPASEARQLRDDPARQAEMLGAAPQNAAGVEVFALSDLGELGLAGFLREGVDAHPDALERDKVKLAALDGWVLLVHSSAFAQDGASLTPAAPLTLIGTYTQTPPDKPQIDLAADAAKPYTGTPAESAPTQGQSGSRGSWVVIALAIVVVAILWWALSG